MAGDPTLFAREDSIEESWRIVEPILTDYPKCVEYEPRHAGDRPPHARWLAATATGPKNPRPDRRGSDLGPATRPGRCATAPPSGATPAATPAAPTCRCTAEGEAQARRLGRAAGRPPVRPRAGQPAAPGPADLRAGRLRRAGRGRRRPGRVGLRRLRGLHHRRRSASTAPGWTVWNGPCPRRRDARPGRRPRRPGHRPDPGAPPARSPLFAHGHILRVLTARWCGLDPAEGRCFSLDTATLSVLGWEHEYPTVRRWNAGDRHVLGWPPWPMDSVRSPASRSSI